MKPWNYIWFKGIWTVAEVIPTFFCVYAAAMRKGFYAPKSPVTDALLDDALLTYGNESTGVQSNIHSVSYERTKEHV